VIIPACAVFATGSTAKEIAIRSATDRWNDEQIIVSLQMSYEELGSQEED